MEYVAELSRIPYEELMTELQYSCENMNFIEDNVMTLIQQIRNKGMAVVIATDNMDTFSRWTAPALKLDKLFDDILLSVDRGALKTDTDADGTSAFFNHFFLSTGIKPKESLLIDDSRNNKAVERFGMNFQHVSNSEPLSTHLINFTQL
jgi:FMN phosphatase YigB (HAD superfamily)